MNLTVKKMIAISTTIRTPCTPHLSIWYTEQTKKKGFCRFNSKNNAYIIDNCTPNLRICVSSQTQNKHLK